MYRCRLEPPLSLQVSHPGEQPDHKPRALSTLGLQGIYRVSGSRIRVERLCQAFENGRALVELSGNSPHDVTGVLKRFLQEVGAPGGRAGAQDFGFGTWAPAHTCIPDPLHPQLTDPVVPFHFYDAFISLAKTLHADPRDDPGTASPSPEVIRSLKTLLAQLPDSNYNTLRHLVAHLFRYARVPKPSKGTLSPGHATAALYG